MCVFSARKGIKQREVYLLLMDRPDCDARDSSGTETQGAGT